MMTRKKQSVDLRSVAKAIYDLASALEESGNGGSYRSSGDWVLLPAYKQYRDGILFFSTGWGWRVRKKPHWKTVFQERFGAWYQPPTEGA